MKWFTIVLILSKTAWGFGSASPALFEGMIDPVQSEKADKDHRDRLPQLIRSLLGRVLHEIITRGRNWTSGREIL